ncbi:MAG: phenylacetate--CoA ligase family protein [Planctomycetota bacterium]|jgi:phenylacetate-CoA ligase
MKTRGGPFAALRMARRLRRFKKEDYLRLQGEQLRALVRHAYDRVPFYRRLYDAAGFDPESVRGIEDLEHIPIARKEDMQGLPRSELVARGLDVGRLKEQWTSGSTGQPLVTRRLGSENRMGGAVRMDVYRSLGMRRSDKLAVIAYLPQAEKAPQRPLLRLLGRFGLYGYQLVHCLDSPDEMAEKLIRGRPKVIAGLASVLCRLNESRYVDELRGLGVRFVAPGGQVLTRAMRRAIEDAFRARAYDFYAAYEMGTIAWECAETGEMHTNDGCVISEVLCEKDRPAEPGEKGEYVGTKLHVYSMPFIRYRLADLVTRGSPQCRCGAPLGTIREIVGKQADYFHLPDGRMMHFTEIGVDAVMESYDWILRSQMVQERKDFVRMRVQARVPPTAEELRRLEENMRRVLGPQVELRCELVDELGLEKSGKFQTVISNVSSFYGGSRPAVGRSTH